MAKLTLIKDTAGNVTGAKIGTTTIDGFVTASASLVRGNYEATLKINFTELAIEETSSVEE